MCEFYMYLKNDPTGNSQEKFKDVVTISNLVSMILNSHLSGAWITKQNPC